MEKVNKLLNKYLEIMNELQEYIPDYLDSMYWDLIGYKESISDGVKIDMDILESHVGALENTLNGFKNINFTYC